MSSSLNSVQLIGNMTADPEVKETPNGHKVASFSIATNQVWKDAAGVKQEKTDFHNIIAWSGLAEIVEKYTTKGKKLFIQGRLQTRSWDDANGSKRYRTEIVADNIILLTPKGDQEERKPSEAEQELFGKEAKPVQSYKNKVKAKEDITIEDIPF